MKKVFFVAALFGAVALTSCNGNGSKAASDDQTTADSLAAASEATAAEALDTAKQALENAADSVNAAADSLTDGE